MFTNQNRFEKQIQFLLAAVALLWLCGCTPSGPRALLHGKRLIEQGKYADAVEDLKVATSLMATNAQAWNYLGLAYHHSGQAANAVEAYQRALKLNHDLIVVHYNLGCLLLEENRPDTLEGARNELTAFTLHQGKSLDGWLKLGAAQLRLGELSAAEVSFKQALQLNPQSAEALNDLGMVQLQRKRWRDAATFFNSALRQQPKYGPAMLNLAVVDIYLNQRQAALQKYRDYLALTPRPANWNAVASAAQQLDEELNPPARPAPPEMVAATSIASNNPPRVASVTNVSRPEPAPNTNANAPRNVAVASPSRPVNPVETTPKPDVVRLTESPAIKPVDSSAAVSTQLVSAPKSSIDDGSAMPDELETPAKPPKRGFFQRLNPMGLFRHQPKTTNSPATGSSLPPAVPLATDSNRNVNSSAEVTSKPVPARVITLARYPYLLTGKPTAGNRSEAESWLAKGIDAQRSRRLHEAETFYMNATRSDPAYFDAQTSLGAVAFAAGDLPQALRAYELALAIEPDSFEARFHFGVVLKKANYIQDAAEELERLLAAKPNELPTRLASVHLELGNLYAGQFHQNTIARSHYLKVLELDPQNSQATAIRYWLLQNPL